MPADSFCTDVVTEISLVHTGVVEYQRVIYGLSFNWLHKVPFASIQKLRLWRKRTSFCFSIGLLDVAYLLHCDYYDIVVITRLTTTAPIFDATFAGIFLGDASPVTRIQHINSQLFKNEASNR